MSCDGNAAELLATSTCPPATGFMALAVGVCFDNTGGPAQRINLDAIMPSSTCSPPTGGTPTGSLALENPVTFCCNL